MPYQDGTGPDGSGPVGLGLGPCGGGTVQRGRRLFGWGRRGRGRGFGGAAVGRRLVSSGDSLQAEKSWLENRLNAVNEALKSDSQK